MTASCARSVFAVLVVLATATTCRAADWTYVVQPGDNPWTLTERFLDGMQYWPKIQRYNRIRDPYRIAPGTVLRMPEEWLRAEPLAVQVASVSRDAWVFRVDARTEPLTLATPIGGNDRIRTAPDATLELRFADGSQVRVLGDSELRIRRHVRYANTDMFDTRVELVRGRTVNLPRTTSGSAGRFEIHTPAAISSVRGTRFRVGVDGPQATSETLEGIVRVANSAGEITLGPATGTVALAGQPPLAAVPLLPAPDLSALPALVERSPIAFRVPSLRDAAGYRLQLSVDPAFGTVLQDAVFATPVLQASPVPDGDYYVLVRGIDERRIEGLDAVARLRLNAEPEPPVLIEPTPNALLVDPRPRFRWAQVPGASGYRFELATTPELASPMIDQPALTANELAPDQDLPLGTWYWRVTASDRDGPGPRGPVQQLRRIPPAPSIEAPTISEDALTLRWAADAPGSRYRVQIAGNAQMSEPLVDEVRDAPEIVLPRPRPGNYYMRVRVRYADGAEGPFGRTQQFELPAPPPDKPWWLLIPFLLLLLTL